MVNILRRKDIHVYDFPFIIIAPVLTFFNTLVYAQRSYMEDLISNAWYTHKIEKKI